jgi:hypothetical protein
LTPATPADNMDGLNPEAVAEYNHFGTDAFVDFCR